MVEGKINDFFDIKGREISSQSGKHTYTRYRVQTIQMDALKFLRPLLDVDRD